MKTPVPLTLCLMWIAAAPALAQRIENGDFSRGPAIWKGDRKIVDDPADSKKKVLELDLNPHKRAIFYQVVDTGGSKAVCLTFRMKTSNDYQGDGITIRMTRSDGTYVWQDFPAQGPEWHHIVWTFDEVNGARKLTMAIEGKEGYGKLYFSDFSLEKANSQP